MKSYNELKTSDKCTTIYVVSHVVNTNQLQLDFNFHITLRNRSVSIYPYQILGLSPKNLKPVEFIYDPSIDDVYTTNGKTNLSLKKYISYSFKNLTTEEIINSLLSRAILFDKENHSIVTLSKQIAYNFLYNFSIRQYNLYYLPKFQKSINNLTDYILKEPNLINIENLSNSEYFIGSINIPEWTFNYEDNIFISETSLKVDKSNVSIFNVKFIEKVRGNIRYRYIKVNLKSKRKTYLINKNDVEITKDIRQATELRNSKLYYRIDELTSLIEDFKGKIEKIKEGI